MPPRRIESHLPLTPVTFQVLVSLVRGPMHGYGVRRDVEQRTEGRFTLGAGTLYTRLQRMEESGLIRETGTPEGFEDEASSRWRFYQITGLGEQVLRAEVLRLESDAAAARALLAEAGRT